MRNPPELLGIQWLHSWVILRQLNCARQFPQLATQPKVSSLQLHAAHRFEFKLLPAGKPGSQPTGQRSYSARVQKLQCAGTARIKRIPQSIAHEVHAQHRNQNKQTRKHPKPRRTLQIAV
ncbi:MAG: hypothetical protein RL334_1322 [Chloroflexota bacterium]